jgi:hypothetical protein
VARAATRATRSHDPEAIYPGPPRLTSVPGDPSGLPQHAPLRRASFAISRGHVMAPAGPGFVAARGEDGRHLDILDVADALTPTYDGLYIIDLDGRRKGEPQLDYLQELAREADVWLDAGVQVADESIDALVTGARRVVLSTATLASSRELRRAWKMSTEIVAEVVIGDDGKVSARDETWATQSPEEVSAGIRALGVSPILLTVRDATPDWSTARRVAEGGPTWVTVAAESSSLPALAEAHLEGGVLVLSTSELMTLVAPVDPLRSTP